MMNVYLSDEMTLFIIDPCLYVIVTTEVLTERECKGLYEPKKVTVVNR